MSNAQRVTVKPVRPYRRFQGERVAFTGLDHVGNYKHFISKDPMANIDVHRDRKFKTRFDDNVQIPIGQTPFGTTKHTYKLGLDTEGKL